MKPWYQQRTFWLTAGAILTAGMVLVETGITPSHVLAFLATACAAIGSTTARSGAANESQEKLQSLASSVSEHVADTGDPIAAAQIVNSVKLEGGAG